jgi:hypothetical protein
VSGDAARRDKMKTRRDAWLMGTMHAEPEVVRVTRRAEVLDVNGEPMPGWFHIRFADRGGLVVHESNLADNPCSYCNCAAKAGME